MFYNAGPRVEIIFMESRNILAYCGIWVNQLPASASSRVKNHKIAKNSTTTKARKTSKDFESLEFYLKNFVCLTEFKNNSILLNKICHTFRVGGNQPI
jgi:hypothetical protein